MLCKNCWTSFAVAFLVVVVAGCTTRSPVPAAGKSAAKLIPTRYEARGVVQTLDRDDKTVTINHEEIPGYMPAMVMPFEVKDVNQLNGLQPGDTVSFQMVVTETDGWIERVLKLDVPRTAPAASRLITLRDVEPLKEGEMLPNYQFTNQLNQVTSIEQLRGRALAITFIYTRCPFPNFCPRMLRNFHEVQEKLKSMMNAPTNWHLLSISFDPEYDTLSLLKTHAEESNYDPQHWSFLTGEMAEVMAITEQFGVIYWHETPGDPSSANLRILSEPGAQRRQRARMNHRLCTVVVDLQGRVQKIFTGNRWTSAKLVAEMLKAADVKL